MKRIALLFFVVSSFIFAFTGKVVKVADEDTIRVRFYGIDAPKKKLGLWKNPDAIAPWEFRRKKK